MAALIISEYFGCAEGFFGFAAFFLGVFLTGAGAASAMAS